MNSLHRKNTLLFCKVLSIMFHILYFFMKNLAHIDFIDGFFMFVLFFFLNLWHKLITLTQIYNSSSIHYE